jgi:alpha-beta hydrolase superfamily lysophospholipase
LAPSSVVLRTSDGVRLRGALWSPDHAADLAIVVGHGLTNHIRKPVVSRVLRRLATHATVVAFDFRGHGRSAGGSTVGDAEVLDVAAAVELARARGHRRVVTLGFSMGASIVLRHAAGCAPLPHGTDPGVDAVAAVSSPSRWWVRETDAMRRVHWLLEQPHGRMAARALRLRLGAPWTAPPESPVEAVHRIAPTPLLIVHGTDDHYFPPDHATALQRASGGHGQLWLLPGMRHAESAMTPDLVDRLAAWLAGNPVPTDDSNRDEKDELAA